MSAHREIPLSVDTTSDLREWARQNGYAVGDRGRLPAQIHTAWEEDAQRNKAKTTRRRTTSKAPAPRATTPKPLAGASSGPAKIKDITALQIQMAALTDRVQQLEKKLAAATAASKATKKAARRV
jgi:hypothetical protein